MELELRRSASLTRRAPARQHAPGSPTRYRIRQPFSPWASLTLLLNLNPCGGIGGDDFMLLFGGRAHERRVTSSPARFQEGRSSCAASSSNQLKESATHSARTKRGCLQTSSERLQGPYRVPRRRRWALWRVLEKRGASASSQLARYGRATADRAGRAGAAGLNGPGHPVPCWSTLGVKGEGEMASGAGRAAIGRLRPCGIWPCLASVPSGLEPALQQSRAEQS